jgi:hypothetical protein
MLANYMLLRVHFLAPVSSFSPSMAGCTDIDMQTQVLRIYINRPLRFACYPTSSYPDMIPSIPSKFLVCENDNNGDRCHCRPHPLSSVPHASRTARDYFSNALPETATLKRSNQRMRPACGVLAATGHGESCFMLSRCHKSVRS